MRCVRNRSVVPALQLLKMEKEKKKKKYICTEELSNKEKVYHLTLGDPDS